MSVLNPRATRPLRNGTFAVALTLLSLGIGACGSGNRGEPVAVGSDEGAAAAFPGVPEAAERESLVPSGVAVYSKYGCGNCHAQGDGRDSLVGPPLGKVALRHLTRQKGDELATRRWMFSHIRNPAGHPGLFHNDGSYSSKMPAFAQIPVEELRALVEFLMTKR